jgi:hypothetical protein
MTLDEAVAKYKEERALFERACLYTDSGIDDADREPLDAAVRDVALAVLDGAGHGNPYGHEAKYGCQVCAVKRKIDRLLPEGSGKGE